MFQNTTIEVKDNILVTGDNGSGKSTLLDAIQYILTAGETKFNTAANASAKRQLKGYLRGKLGIEGKEYLRVADVITHIALEYYDEKTKVSQLIGAVLEIGENDYIKKRFYQVHGATIEDEMYVSGGYPRDWSSFKQYVEAQEYQLNYEESKRNVQNMFRQALGVDKKYFELIHRALAFKPIDNLNSFIFDFLLPKENISVNNLRDNIRKYREFDKDLKHLEQSCELLEKIEEHHTSYRNAQVEIERKSYLGVQLNMDELRARETEVRVEIEQNTQKRKQAEVSVKEKESTQNERQKERSLLEQQLLSNEGYARVQALKTRLTYVQRDFYQAENRYQQFIEILAKEKSIMQEIGIESELWADSVEELSRDSDKLSQGLENSNRIIISKKSQFLEERIQAGNKRQLQQEQVAQLKKELVQLEKARFRYPDHAERLLEILRMKVGEHFHESVEIKPFCEYLDIKDSEWRDAVEGFLNTQRYNILIDPKYFPYAMQVYEQYKKQHGLFGIGIVDVEKLSHYTETAEQTLASKVIAATSFSQNYVNMLLNTVVCVDEVKELRQHKRAITSSCMLYTNYTVRAIDPKIYQKPFIGRQALEIQKKNIEAELKQLEKDVEKSTRAFNKANHLYELSHQSQVQSLQHEVNCLERYRSIVQELTQMKEQIAELEKDASWITLQEQLKTIEEQMAEEGRKLAKLYGEIAVYNENTRHAEIQKEVLERRRPEVVAELEQKQLQFSEIQLEVEQEALTLKQRYKTDFVQMKKQAENKLQAARIAFVAKEHELLQAMRAFNTFSQIGFEENVDDIFSYLNQFYTIRDINIRDRREEVRLAQYKCEQSFQEGFVSQLREKIKRAEDNLAELNSSLKNKKFNGDVYEFVVGPSKRQNYRDYYDIIMSGEDFFAENLFVASLSGKNRDIMNELFETLNAVDDESQNEQILDAYIDYRHYMDYDIKIKHENGDITFFSKVNKEKSGGETQTPFYVIIASSFEQLIKTNRQEDTGCVVMFDEAFNNMDETRIQTMMEFYHSLNIQIIIAVPPGRMQTISPYVETVLTLVNKKHQIYAKEFFKNDES